MFDDISDRVWRYFHFKRRFCKNKDYLQDELVEEGKLAGLDGTIIQSMFDDVAQEDDLSIRQWVPRPLQWVLKKEEEKNILKKIVLAYHNIYI